MINQKKYTNIKLINIFLFFYFIIIPFLLIKNKQNYVLGIIIAFIGYLSFSIGFNVSFNNKVLLKNRFNDNNFKRILFSIFILQDFIKIIGFIINGVNQNAYNIDYLEAGGSNSLYMMIISKSIYFIKLYIYSGYISKNKKTFFSVFIISLAASFTSRVRFDIITVLVFFIIYGNYFNYIKLNFFKIGIAIIISPIIMLATLIKRDFVGSLDIFSIIENIKQTLLSFYYNNQLLDMIKMSMESFETFNIYNNVITDNLIIPLSGMFRIIFNFIPRSIWPNKPYPMQVMLAYEYNKNAYYAGGGIFANIYGDAYLNGGIIGIVVILFVLGVLSRKIYTSSQISTESKNVNVGMYCLFVTFFINFYRGYLSDMTWQLVLYLIIFKVMNNFEKIKIRI